MPALRDLRAAARRRRAGARPTGSASGSPTRPQLEEDVALGQHRPRPARPGAHPALVRRRGRGRGPHRGRPRLPARRARVPQRAPRRAAERATSRCRWPGSCSSRPTSSRSTSGCRTAPTRRSPAMAAKAVKEVDYHRDHATQWVLRLGDGTDESHRRMQAGLERLWPYVDELFGTDDLEQSLVADGVAVDASALRAGWDGYVDGVLAEATLTRPEGTAHPARRRPARHPHRAAGLPARRDAAPAPRPPGGVVVSTALADPRRGAGGRRGGARPRGAGADASPTSGCCATSRWPTTAASS